MTCELIVLNDVLGTSIYEQRGGLRHHLGVEHNDIRVIVVKRVAFDIHGLPRFVVLLISGIVDLVDLDSFIVGRPACGQRVAILDVESTLNLWHIDLIPRTVASVEPSSLINAVSKSSIKQEE